MESIIDKFFKRIRSNNSKETPDIPHNPSGGEFLDSVKSSIRKSIDKFSVTANSLVVNNNGINRNGNPFGAAGVLAGNSNTDSSFSDSDLGSALPVDTNKIARIQSYDSLARHPELDWCINEIANDFLHQDINGEYLILKLKCEDSKFTSGEDTILQEEFKNLVSLYDLKTMGYNMIRKFLIEGEICFENVIDYNHPEYGIIGFKYIPTMFYDFLRNRNTGQIEGLYLDPDRLKTYSQFSSYGGTSYAGQSASVFNAIRQVPAYSYTYSLDTKNKIIMPFEQVTYMNSGILSEDGSVVFPVIEKVAVPVRQLFLMQDALVIYRITRAPEKLVFNVDFAGLPGKKAEQKIREMAMAHKSRKAVQGSGAVTNVYNAETMFDAYYFWKTGEGAGTTVSNLAATAHYNEMHDVEYFLKRILKFLSIPWQRWSESQANRQDKQSIQNEEYSFAQNIVRFQTMFSAAVKKTFITHLRMKGLFSKYELHESDIQVEMIPPALYENYQAQTRFKDALDIISSASSLEFLSKNMLLKTVFNYTDGQIKENEVEVRREMLYKAQTEWMTEQLKAGKANANIYLDNKKYTEIANNGEGGAGGDNGGGGDLGGLGGDMGGGTGGDLGGLGGDMGGGSNNGGGDLGGLGGDMGGGDSSGGATGGGTGGDLGGLGGDMGGNSGTSGGDMGGGAGGGTAPSNNLDLGSDEMNATADAGFNKFANDKNITQTTTDDFDKQDDSGKTDIELNMNENPEYGDFGELVHDKLKHHITKYPETDREKENLKNNGKANLTDVFHDVLDTTGNTSYNALTHIFNKEFKSSIKGKKKSTLTNAFNKSFKSGKSSEGNDKSLGKTFDKAFNKNTSDKTEKSNSKKSKTTDSLEKTFNKSFNNKDNNVKRKSSTKKSVTKSNTKEQPTEKLTSIFNTEFSTNDKNTEGHTSLENTFKKSFNTFKSNEDTNSKLSDVFNDAFTTEE